MHVWFFVCVFYNKFVTKLIHKGRTSIHVHVCIQLTIKPMRVVFSQSSKQAVMGCCQGINFSFFVIIDELKQPVIRNK